VENGQAGKPGKAGTGQVKIRSNPANAGIRIKAGEDGVGKHKAKRKKEKGKREKENVKVRSKNEILMGFKKQDGVIELYFSGRCTSHRLF